MKTLLVPGCTLALLAGIALAVDAPTKDGLWSIHIVSTITSTGTTKPKPTDVTMSRCQNKSVPLQLPGDPPKGAECKEISKSSSGSTRFFEMQCTQNGRTTRVKETVTMKGENEAHTITDSTMEPPMGGMSGMKLVGPDGKVMQPPKR